MTKLQTKPPIDPGAKILDRTFSDLRSSREALRSMRDAGLQLGPEARITRYLQRLQDVLSLIPKDRNRLTPSDRLVRWLETKAVLDTTDPKLVEKVARGIFDSEKRAYVERGHGALVQHSCFEAQRADYEKLVTEKRNLQISSLARWVDYLVKNDAQYPPWFRYLAMRCVTKMGIYNRDTPTFHSRSKDTTAPFPELNPEALGLVYKVLAKAADIDTLLTNFDPDNIVPFRKALSAGSFSALYAVALRECNKAIDRSRLDGEWKKYDKGSDYRLLEEDLLGRGTGWCTATGSAEKHISGGDFYVFYTKDTHEQYTVPRVAIRMEKNSIAEIRGIAPGQELEPDFLEIAEEKGKSLPGYARFEKASADMKRLTTIDKRCFVRNADGKVAEALTPYPPLSFDELRFLYQVDSPIASFGTEDCPRVKEILASRPDTRSDYAVLYGISPDHVALSKEEISSDTRVYVGKLRSNDYRIFNERNDPLVITGDVYFYGCAELKRIPPGVTFHGSATFACCTALTTIPQGVVFNQNANFWGSYSIKSICDEVVFKGDANFLGNRSLKEIGASARFHGTARFHKGHSIISDPREFILKRAVRADAIGADAQKHKVF